MKTYLRCIVVDEGGNFLNQPTRLHAGRVPTKGSVVTLCTDTPATIAPDNFDPEADNACPDCRKKVLAD